MTVTYTAQVATCTGLGCFWKLLFRYHLSLLFFILHNIMYLICLPQLERLYLQITLAKPGCLRSSVLCTLFCLPIRFG
jgi:bestrophin-3